MMMNILILSVAIFTAAQSLPVDIECPCSQEESTRSIYMDDSIYKLYIASSSSHVLIAIGVFVWKDFRETTIALVVVEQMYSMELMRRLWFMWSLAILLSSEWFIKSNLPSSMHTMELYFAITPNEFVLLNDQELNWFPYLTHFSVFLLTFVFMYSPSEQCVLNNLTRFDVHFKKLCLTRIISNTGLRISFTKFAVDIIIYSLFLWVLQFKSGVKRLVGRYFISLMNWIQYNWWYVQWTIGHIELKDSWPYIRRKLHGKKSLERETRRKRKHHENRIANYKRKKDVPCLSSLILIGYQAFTVQYLYLLKIDYQQKCRK